uniref:Nucleoporin Nup37 n=1 Tax=Suricata suricatta TaxID=37032 RepID=A0A673TMY1_SURSU
MRLTWLKVDPVGADPTEAKSGRAAVSKLFILILNLAGRLGSQSLLPPSDPEANSERTAAAPNGDQIPSGHFLTPPEEEADIAGIQYKTLRTLQHGVRVDGIAWSPETRLDSLPPVIKFCTSAADMKIRIFTSDLQDKNEYKVLEGHSDFINGLVFEPKEGQELASVSDDHTCRIWNLEGMQTAHFVLHSPGMSVCWHPEETFKLMVAEKSGTIRFYDLLAQQAILSLEAEQMPLMSAHWCLKNTFKVGAVAGNDWLIWDITRSSYPQDKRPVHMDQACLFRWSTVNENLFATTGYPGKMASQFQIHHLGHPQPVLIGSVAVGSGLSWHRTLPLCAIGGDHKLLFWVTEM